MEKTFLFLLVAVFTQSAFSQNDSLIFSNVIEGRTANDINAPIYNGQEHIGYSPLIEGIPYYQLREWQQGVLVFQNISYRDAYLKYDLVADQVIVRHPNGITGIILFTRRIQSFTLGGKHFIYLPDDEASGLKNGIYEELVKGKISLYAKRSKLIDEKIAQNEIERKFINNDQFYVLKDGNFRPVRKQKTIMELVGDKRKEVSASLKASKLKFRLNRELALIQIANSYNQLSY